MGRTEEKRLKGKRKPNRNPPTAVCWQPSADSEENRYFLGFIRKKKNICIDN